MCRMETAAGRSVVDDVQDVRGMGVTECFIILVFHHSIIPCVSLRGRGGPARLARA